MEIKKIGTLQSEVKESTGKLDFLGNEIFVGSNIVYLWHCKTRSEYKNGVVIGCGDSSIVNYRNYYINGKYALQKYTKREFPSWLLTK